MGLLFIAITGISVAVNVFLFKAKAKLMAKFEQDRDPGTKIYEEIDQVPQPVMDTNTNVAYASRCSALRSVIM